MPHVDLSTLDLLDWDLADEITEERLKKACMDVATAITPSCFINQTNYICTSNDGGAFLSNGKNNKICADIVLGKLVSDVRTV